MVHWYWFPSPSETFHRVSTTMLMSVVPKSEGILSAFLSFIVDYTLKQKPSKSRGFEAEIAAPNLKGPVVSYFGSAERTFKIFLITHLLY